MSNVLKFIDEIKAGTVVPGNMRIIQGITCEEANLILEQYNKYNRPWRHKVVTKYEPSFKADLFGTTVCEGRFFHFDEEGQLLSGQHRLAAMVNTGKGLDDVLVCCNLRSDWIPISQEKRTVQDLCAMKWADKLSPKTTRIMSTVCAQYTTVTSAIPHVSAHARRGDIFAKAVEAEGIHPFIGNLAEKYPAKAENAIKAAACALIAGLITEEDVVRYLSYWERMGFVFDPEQSQKKLVDYFHHLACWKKGVYWSPLPMAKSDSLRIYWEVTKNDTVNYE